MKSGDIKLTPEEERVRAALRDLQKMRADERFRERLKQAFVSGSLQERRASEPRQAVPVRPVWRLAFVSVVAVVAITLVFLSRGPTWTLHSVAGLGSVVVDGQNVGVEEPNRLAGLIQPGSRIRVSGKTRVDIRAGDVILVELDGGSDVTIPGAPRRWLTQPLSGTVHSGELRLKTGPGFRGRRLTLSTAEGLIIVTGTVISVFKGDDVTCVCVLEGTARIGKDDAHMEDVSAGLRKVMFSGDRPSKILDIEPHHQEDLLEFQERNKDVFD